MARTLEVTELRISRRTADKIRDEHDLAPEAVRAAVEGVGGLPFRWHVDERGPRAYVVAEVEEQAVLVVLYPAIGCAATVWNLGSAYPV